MKETGIIMSGDHPAKVLADLKTMTRRVIKTQPSNALVCQWDIGINKFYFFKGDSENLEYPISTLKCPYGQVGDLLWVKETWAGHDFALCTKDYRPAYLGKDGLYHPVIHKAGKENYAWGLSGEPKWRTSRFMQKIATRIWLEITSLRVERLQEICYLDILAEGIEPNLIPDEGVFKGIKFIDFPKLWDSINAKRGYGWEKNPWVWVIAFRRLDG